MAETRRMAQMLMTRAKARMLRLLGDFEGGTKAMDEVAPGLGVASPRIDSIFNEL